MNDQNQKENTLSIKNLALLSIQSQTSSIDKLSHLWLKNISMDISFFRKYSVMENYLKLGLNPNSLESSTDLVQNYTPLTSIFKLAQENYPKNWKEKAFKEDMALSSSEAIQTINLLLKYKADINLPDKTGQTVLRRAILKKEQAIVTHLITHKANINPSDKILAQSNGINLIPALTYKRQKRSLSHCLEIFEKTDNLNSINKLTTKK